MDSLGPVLGLAFFVWVAFEIGRRWDASKLEVKKKLAEEKVVFEARKVVDQRQKMQLEEMKRRYGK